MAMPPDLSAALAAVLQGWNSAARQWDARALAALYTDDALFFGGRPSHAVGRPAIEQYFLSYAGEILSGRLELADQHVLQLDAGNFLAQGYGDFSFVLRPDLRTASRLRTSWLLTRQGQDWKIRQHHFSPPPAVPPLGR